MPEGAPGSRYDAIVVGGGHNGLVCAGYLARGGLRTVLLERAERVGGACVTDRPWPGYRISAAAHSVALPDRTILDELGCRVEIIARDPSAFAPLERGGGLFLWREPAKTRAAIEGLGTGDADGYERLVALFDEAAARLRPLLSYPATKKQLRRAFRRSEIDKLYAQTVTASIADAARAHISSDALQGLVASGAIVGSAAGPETPGTAYGFLHQRVAGASGSVRGGLGALADALADAVRAAGAEIRVDAPVARVKLWGRRAAGVVLDDGSEIDADLVCSAVDPARTVALVEPDAWLKEFVDEVAVLPMTGTVAKVNCALGSLPRFAGLDGDAPGPEHATSLTIAPSIGYLEKACRAAAEGEVADGLFCKAVFESVVDPSMAPEGKHTLSVVAQYAPHDGAWDERRDELGDRVIATLERYAPGLSDAIEEREVLTPSDIEARYGMTGGHIFHGEMLPDWLFDERPARGWHRYRTPVPRLYMCGAGTHPGGGITGIPGRNAARAILEDVAAADAGTLA